MSISTIDIFQDYICLGDCYGQDLRVIKIGCHQEAEYPLVTENQVALLGNNAILAVMTESEDSYWELRPTVLLFDLKSLPWNEQRKNGTPILITIPMRKRFINLATEPERIYFLGNRELIIEGSDTEGIHMKAVDY